MAVCCLYAITVLGGGTSVNGFISNQKGQPVVGALISFPDLKASTSTDSLGHFSIANLPKTSLHLIISAPGYELFSTQLNPDSTPNLNSVLTESVVELHEVAVTGLSQSTELRRTAVAMSVVSTAELRQQGSTNLIDAIAHVPGVSQITTGSGISKPVIRGMGYNRVLVVSDGVRQEGNQWGDEHGVEIDEYSVSKVEVLKGPASLSFGSDALAGVIQMFSAPTLPVNHIAGNVLFNYQTNNGLIGGSANLQGNNNGIVWSARYSGKWAHTYQNRYDGYVYNSGFQERSFSGLLGINRSWGYIHVQGSAYRLQPGIIEGERDSTGAFLKEVNQGGVATDEQASKRDYLSYQQGFPRQQVDHYKAILNASFILRHGILKTVLGYQQNQRREFTDVTMPNQYGLYFQLHTFTYDVQYRITALKGIQFTFGANGMYQQSRNRGSEFLIPEYRLFDIGAFILARKNFGRLDIAAGFRTDVRTQSADALYLHADGSAGTPSDSGAVQKFSGFNNNFTGLSFSVGATYQFNENFYLKLNMAKGYRAPNPAELGSNGVHEGTATYQIGSSRLRPENSYQADLGFGFQSRHITIDIAGFYNYINNYIFLQKVRGAMGDSITEGAVTYQYASGNAHLFGGEVAVDIHPHPLDWLHLESAFSYVRSQQFGQPDSTRYLPFMPAPRLQGGIRVTAKKLGRILQQAYAGVSFVYTFRQPLYYAAYGTETATSGYGLLNASLGTDFVWKNRTICSIFFNADNLLDVAYQSHLSRLKYLDENQATGRRGVFNMGRNFSIKLVVPFEFKVAKNG